MTDLLTNLEQAEFCNKSLMLSVCEHLGVNIHTMVLNGRTTLWTLIDARAWESTAIALIEEVGQTVRYISWHRFSPDPLVVHATVGITRQASKVGVHKEPALALCIALLKALETGGDHD